MDTINDSKYILNDLLSGDEKIFKLLEKYNLSVEDLEKAYKLIINNPELSNNEKQFYFDNSWRINYKIKPPKDVNDYLTPEWIGDMNVYPHVRQDLNYFFNPNEEHRNLILSPCIGYGKSTEAVLATTYIISTVACMRNPKRFFSQSTMTSLSVVFGSFTLSQSARLLKKPFYNLLQNSPKFKRVKQEDMIELAQEDEIKNGTNRIVWSTASKMEGIFSVSNDINGILISDPYSLLGLTIIVGILSELSFFMKRGVSADDIAKFYNDLKGRQWSRFHYDYWARTIMDSSPNSFHSPIDRYVFSGEASQDPKNMVVTSSHWDVFPNYYAEWQKTGKTFSIFRGSGGKPTCEVKGENERKKYNPEEIVDVPIDLYGLYKQDPVKIVKDYCGYPSEGDDKLITDYAVIEDMFDKQLKNIEGSIKAQATKRPEFLIWEQVKDIFFIKTGNLKYNFYRASREKRYLAVDQSTTTDATGIVMLHPEMDYRGEMVVVIDFSIVIVPDRYKINLEAIYYFITELKKYGGIVFGGVYFDQFQSDLTREKLKREEYPVDRFSVDSNKGAYLTLISWIKNNRIKAGRNIFIKNNLKSLQEVTLKDGKTKIDHILGKIENNYDGNWNTSLAGINAKDITDPMASAFYNCINNYQGVPRYQWVDSNDPYYETNERENLNLVLKGMGFKI